jgi:hypothetical protein
MPKLANSAFTNQNHVQKFLGSHPMQRNITLGHNHQHPYKSAIERLVSQPHLQSYTQDRNNWTEPDMDSINCNAPGGQSTFLNVTCQTQLTKLFHKILQTATVMQRYDPNPPNMPLLQDDWKKMVIAY